MKEEAKDLIKYAKSILYLVIPNINQLVFTDLSALNVKSNREPVSEDLVAKIKSK